MRKQVQPVTVEQMTALRTYAEREGRTWKALQVLRNSHGPRWLIGFKFPAAS
jgi:hypothetical protein